MSCLGANMLRHVLDEDQCQPGGHTDEASDEERALPNGTLARRRHALPRHGLQRLLALAEPRAPLLVEHGDGPPRRFRHDEWWIFSRQIVVDERIGRTFGRFRLDNGDEATLSRDPSSERLYAPFDLAAAYDSYVSESWAAATRQRKLSPRQLNAFYLVKQFIPRPVQLAIRRLFMRWQGLPTFPAWPLDRSVVRLLHLYAFCVLLAQGKSEAPFRWFWPRRHHAAMTLTHDVEGEEGLRLALDVADLEEELGFRSSFNLGGWYRPDPGLLHELTRRGFEIGVHGLRHDRSLFATRASFEAQQPALRDLIERLGAVGFRSPATHRVFEWIGELPVEYDCTIPHSDPYEPQPGGCCSVWPFFIGRVIELPYTLPQDHTLFTLLGHRTPDAWVEQALRIEKEHGLIECLTHPDRGYLGNARERAIYREFLRAMAERPHVWKALPRDVAAWWRSRDLGEAETDDGVVRIGDSPEDVTLEPPVSA
jgi:peptidoglycan/xylan/chitin deacetylase (PgdA/CDA1 family)